QVFPIRDDTAWIPAGGDEAVDLFALQIDGGDGVVPADGDKKFPARQGNGAGGAAERKLLVRADGDRVADFARDRVDDADGVGVGVGDVEGLAVAAQLDVGRVQADGNFGDLLTGVEIEHGDGSAVGDAAVVDDGRRPAAVGGLVPLARPPAAPVRDEGGLAISGDRN